MVAKRGNFCFLKIYCINCGKEISLNPKNIRAYLCNEFPSYHKGCYWQGKTNIRKNYIPSWNKGTKGLMKPNSTSFKKGHNSWNSEQGKIQTAIKNLEKKRLERIAKEKLEEKPKEILDIPEVNINPNKKMIKCIKTDKIRKSCYIKDCENYNFCHTFKHPKIKKVLKNYRTLDEIL
jgi:hypothetical protein